MAAPQWRLHPDEHGKGVGRWIVGLHIMEGIGELGATGVAAAVANAVYDAIGLRVRDLPITPEKILAV
jgi:CO/xanthine dehydrogenase Mo-binding subunit